MASAPEDGVSAAHAMHPSIIPAAISSNRIAHAILEMETPKKSPCFSHPPSRGVVARSDTTTPDGPAPGGLYLLQHPASKSFAANSQNPDKLQRFESTCFVRTAPKVR